VLRIRFGSNVSKLTIHLKRMSELEYAVETMPTHVKCVHCGYNNIGISKCGFENKLKV
jgi:Zn ribbon nucleic-acid-binding protein